MTRWAEVLRRLTTHLFQASLFQPCSIVMNELVVIKINWIALPHSYGSIRMYLNYVWIVFDATSSIRVVSMVDK